VSNGLSETALRFVVVGYITAVAIPPLGLIIGIVIATRSRPEAKHGRWIVLVSVVAGVVWVLVFTSGVLTTPSSDTSY
jgi:hypothetical protein